MILVFYFGLFREVPAATQKLLFVWGDFLLSTMVNHYKPQFGRIFFTFSTHLKQIQENTIPLILFLSLPETQTVTTHVKRHQSPNFGKELSSNLPASLLTIKFKFSATVDDFKKAGEHQWKVDSLSMDRGNEDCGQCGEAGAVFVGRFLSISH